MGIDVLITAITNFLSNTADVVITAVTGFASDAENIIVTGTPDMGQYAPAGAILCFFIVLMIMFNFDR